MPGPSPLTPRLLPLLPAFPQLNMPGLPPFSHHTQAIMEAAISSTLSHPNIVQTYTYTIRPMRDSSAPPAIDQGVSKEDLSMMGIKLGG